MSMFLAALTLGLAGSLHCAGMCSPLVMTVTNMTSRALRNRLVYNAGRVLMYALMGAIVSSIGFALPILKYQNVLSILLSMLLFTIAIVGTKGMRITFLANRINHFTALIKGKFAVLIQRKNFGAMLLMGGLNGLLPCGLTYIALALCVAAPGPVSGFSYMLMFGVGTLPVMLGLVSILPLFTKRFNMIVLSRGLLILSGVLLVLRVFFVHPVEGHEVHENRDGIVICR